MNAQTGRKGPGDVDLETGGRYDLVTTHGPDLQPGCREMESDDELVDLLHGLRRGGRRRPDQPEHEHPDDRCSEREQDSGRQRAHHELRSTSTGVPVAANANRPRASKRFTRMQPCEAAYAGT